MEATTTKENEMTIWTITYTDRSGIEYTATVEAASFEDADDAATELVSRMARAHRHITIVSVA